MSRLQPLIGLLLVAAVSMGCPVQADEASLAELNDAFLTAIREHRTHDALRLRRQGATASIRGFNAACLNGDYWVAKALVLGGVEVRGTGVGSLGLISAIRSRSGTELARFLLNQGVDPNAPQVMTTALLWGDLPTVEACVFAGGKLDEEEKTTWAFEAAATNVRDGDNIFRWLMTRGLDVTQRGEDGLTALHHAASGDPTISSRTLRELLSRGPDINAADREGITPLMLAARSGIPDRTRLLLKSGADPSLQDAFGNTAAHWAVAEWGADPIRKDKRYGDKLAIVYLNILRELCDDKRFNPFAKGEESHTARWVAVANGLYDAAALWERYEQRWLKRHRLGNGPIMMHDPGHGRETSRAAMQPLPRRPHC